MFPDYLFFLFKINFTVKKQLISVLIISEYLRKYTSRKNETNLIFNCKNLKNLL